MSHFAQIVRSLGSTLISLVLCVSLSGCLSPIGAGADKTTPARAYPQTRDNPISHSQISASTVSLLHRFNQDANFAKPPDATLKLIHQKALESHDRDLLYGLAELNYVAGERLRHNVKPWESRDARDYYLAAPFMAGFFCFRRIPAQNRTPSISAIAMLVISTIMGLAGLSPKKTALTLPPCSPLACADASQLAGY